MKQKFTALGLSLMLLLAQNIFVFSQTEINNPRSNDELIGLYDDPDLIAVVQVRKILSETAPALLSGNPETLEKIKTTMKSLENDMGFNPYSVEKIVFGMKMNAPTDESFMIVLQMSEPAAAQMDNFFQAQDANAKFAPEINPLKNRIDLLERHLKPIKDDVIPSNQPSEEDLLVIENFQTSVNAIKPLKSERAAYDKLRNDTARLLENFKNYQTLQTSVYSLGDLEKRLTDVKTRGNAISASDADRAAKIAAAEKSLLPVEKEFNELRNRMLATDETKVFAAFSSDGFPNVPGTMPTTAAERKAVFSELQSVVTERLDSLKTLTDTMSAKEVPVSEKLKQLDDEDAKNPAYPLTQTVSRKDETINGKTIVNITTVKKFPETSDVNEKKVDDAFMIYDEKTIVAGERSTLVKVAEAKNSNSNQVAKNMIARAPDALVSFGLNFRNTDISELTELFGESKKAWQVIGSLDSSGSDFSITAAFEKSDVPVNVQPKKKDSASIIKPPDVPGGDDTKELITSMIKSMIGIEAKITVRFDKQKTADFAEKSPEFLSKILRR